MRETPAALRWSKLVAEYEESGLTAAAFAEKKNVKASTFAWWRSKLKGARRPKREPDPEPVFAEVVVATVDPTVVVALDAVPAHIVVDASTDLALLRQVLSALA